MTHQGRPAAAFREKGGEEAIWPRRTLGAEDIQAFGCLLATLALKRFVSTTMRVCLALPITSTSSRASISNVSLRPSTAVRVALAKTDIPGGVDAVWLTSSCTPSVAWPGARCCSTQA